jgi:hypothetical protein
MLELKRVEVPALFGARHVATDYMFESPPPGERILIMRRARRDIGSQTAVEDLPKCLEIGGLDDLRYPAQVGHQSTPRLLEICGP